MKHLIFRPVDSWFFKESRSMDGGGATAIESVFPPAPNTLMGAVRTQIGNAYHLEKKSSWKDFKKDSPLANIIGYGSDYASLKAQGVFLYNHKENQVYYPCPLHVLKHKEEKDKKKQYDFFSLSKQGIHCDLGEKIILPTLDYETQTPLENAWVSHKSLQEILTGKPPKEVITLDNIIHKDYRLGITRDNATRKTEEGKLYQTQHIRLKEDWSIYLGMEGLDEGKAYLKKNIVSRLGGEARMAEIRMHDSTSLSHIASIKPTVDSNQTKLLLILLSPLPIKQQQGTDWVALPNDGFKKIENASPTTWQGEINEKTINIISAHVGKLQRVGGWDMVAHQSLPVRSFIPAGSAWYIQTTNSQESKDIIDVLHGKYLTDENDRALGYGQMAIAIAPTVLTDKSENT